MQTVEQVEALRAQLWDAGFRPVAIFNHDANVKSPGKQPLGDNWRQGALRDPPACTTVAPHPMALNSGILCDGLRAIDFDIDDPAIAQQCRALAADLLGEAPIRTRRNSARFLSLYRAESGTPSKIAITGATHDTKAGQSCKIEVLGAGQQFVAFGTHESGADLEWFPDPPGAEMADALPAVSEGRLSDFLAKAAAIIGALPPKKANGHDPGHQSAEPQADPLRVASALNVIPNTGPADWEAWNNVGMAVWRATGGSDAGNVLWHGWSQRNPSYDADHTNERWQHYRRSPPNKIGAGSLFRMAQQASDPPPAEPPPETDDGPQDWNAPDLDAPPPIAPLSLPILDPWNTLRPVAFPLAAIPAVLRAVVEDRARVIGADPCAIAWACLSACSAAIDGRVRLQMKRHDTWSVPPAIWVAIVGPPSSKKSPIIDTAWAPLHQIQAIDLQRHQAETNEWEALPKAKRNTTPEPRYPRRLVSHDATMEALQKILSKQARGIGVVRDELAGWIGSMEKYAPGKGGAADRAFALQSYNGVPHVVDRIERGTLSLENLLTTICGGIQPDRLRQFSDLTDDGLWQRFVAIIVAPASVGTDEAPSVATELYARAVRSLMNVSPHTRLHLSEEAHAVREDVQARMFTLEQSEVLGQRFVGFLGKMVGLWGRLCLVLHLLTDPDGVLVPGATAAAARTLLLRSVLPNAARVYTAMGGAGGDLEATQSIAGYILTKGLRRIVMSDLTSNVRVCRHRSQEDVRKLLSPLEAGGWLLAEKSYAPTSWLVADQVHAKFAGQAAKEAARRIAVRALITGMEHDDVDRDGKERCD